MNVKCKLISLFLLGLLLNLGSVNLLAGTAKNEKKEAEFAQKVKANVTKLGIGKDSKVQVKLKNGKKLKGYVSEINEGYFVVTDETTNQATQVPYPQTKQVKGNNLSSGVKIAIGLAIFVIFFAIVGIN